MSRSIAKSTSYDPNLKADKNGKALCPKCNNEMDESLHRTIGEGWWLCSKCNHMVITEPMHHENEVLECEIVLLHDYVQNKILEYSAGYMNVDCPKCKGKMSVEKMWWDLNEKKEDNKCRLVLGFVCKDWKNCGYTQTLKVQVPNFAYVANTGRIIQ